MSYYPHGSFGFRHSLDPIFTLITMAGTWNYECADIYSRYLKKRVFHHPDERRCLLFNCCNWGFQTPDCVSLIQELNEYAAGHYKELVVAYLLSSRNRVMASRIIEEQYDPYRSQTKVDYFSTIDDAVSWLREEGFKLPDLSEEDFPEALSAEEYIDDPWSPTELNQSP